MEPKNNTNTKNEETVSEDDIEIFSQLFGKDSAHALSALGVIFSNQIEAMNYRNDEQYVHGLGFADKHRKFLASLAHQYAVNGELSEKQMDALFKIMPDYAEQYLTFSRIVISEEDFKK